MIHKVTNGMEFQFLYKIGITSHATIRKPLLAKVDKV